MDTFVRSAERRERTAAVQAAGTAGKSRGEAYAYFLRI